MKKILYFLPLLALVASCNKSMDNNAPEFTSEESAQVVFRTRSAETRATGVSPVTTANLTAFNVIATSGTSAQSLVWDDGAFSGTPDGDFKGGKYWPSESVSWNFYASNAAMTVSGEDGARAVSIAVADCDNDIVADYLAGAAYKQSNPLVFEHILCQLGTVTMKAPETFMVTNLKVYLTPIYSGSYSVQAVKGELDADKRAGWTRGEASDAFYVVGSANEGVDVPTSNNTYVSGDNDLWLVPGAYQMTASYTITKGDYTADATATANIVLQQGKNNNLGLNSNEDPNIPAPGDIQEIVFTVSVTEWSDAEVPMVFEQN